MKRVLLGIVLVLAGIGPRMVTFSADFYSEFAKPLLNKGPKGDEKAYDLEVKDDARLLDNLKKLFYPDSAAWGGALRRALRTIAIGLLITLFVRAGVKFLVNAENEDEVKKAQMNLIYLIYGAAVILLALRVLGAALNVTTVEWLVGEQNSALARTENNVLLVILWFLKGLAFFAAIVFIVYYGYQMISAFDSEEKVKAARTGIVNVLLALIFIKIIDYLYFIAQEQSFIDNATQLITQISKFVGYVGGIIIVIMLIVAGYYMVTSTGNEENFKKATGILRTAFVIIIMILLFLLIIYQVFFDIVGSQ